MTPDIVDWLREQHRNAVQGGIGWGAWDASEADQLVTRYSEAADLIDRLRAAVGWQDISTAPKDGTIIDLWSPRLKRMADFKWTTMKSGKSTWWGPGGFGPLSSQYPAEFCPDAQPTHWRPLPDLPPGEET